MPLRIQPVKWLRGDPRWFAASPLASYAPIVVLTLLVLSIVEICLGAVWVANLAGSLDFALILQPIVLPCLALFNTVPSAHLHLLAKSNPPKLAIWFSSILGPLHLGAAIIDLAVCSGSGGTGGLRNICWSSKADNHVNESIWSACVGLWLVSAVLYILHVVMAVQARRYIVNLRRQAREQGVQISDLEVVDPDKRRRREEEARKRWKKIVDL